MKQETFFEAAQEVITITKEIKEMEKRKEQLRKALTKHMSDKEMKTITDSALGIRVTKVAAERVQYDVEAAKGVLEPKQFKRIRVITESIDTKKLEDEIASGNIDIEDLREFASMKSSKPYVRITEIEPDENIEDEEVKSQGVAQILRRVVEV